MERSDTLLGQDVGLSSVLQQDCGDIHLVLLSRDVERSVAILIQEDRKRETGGVQCLLRLLVADLSVEKNVFGK